MNLKQTLELLATYPNIKKLSIHGEELLEVEYYPSAAQAQSSVDLIKALGGNDMPSDDVMLFASTPSFDEMLDQPKDEVSL
jgi:hypothetical protein